MLVRKATSDDLEIVLHHRREMFREMGYAANAEAFAQADLLARAFFGKAFAEGNYHGWFCESGATVAAGAGVILIEYHPSPRDPRPRRAWAVNVYTEPAFRRRGLGRRLMNAMIEWCREQGYENLVLHASDEGRPLYESMGFEPTNEMRLNLKG